MKCGHCNVWEYASWTEGHMWCLVLRRVFTPGAPCMVEQLLGFDPWEERHARRVAERALEMLAERKWMICNDVEPVCRCLWSPCPHPDLCRPCGAAYAYALAEAEIERDIKASEEG